jgi:hypothetical protein
MKKIFIASLVVGLLVVFAGPALTQEGPGGQEPNVCDVSFDVDVEKYKDITQFTKEVEKKIGYEVDIYIENLTRELPGDFAMAEAEVFKCDHNEANSADVSLLNTFDVIQDSFYQFVGIAQVNQAAGLLNNQGNVFAAGLTGSPGENVYGLSLVEVAVEKGNIANLLEIQSNDSLNSYDLIRDSFRDFQGLAQVNQASGILNNQDNVMGLAANLDGTTGLVAENDTFLSMQNTANNADVGTTNTVAEIRDSFSRFQGVAQVNQGPGCLNNQANIISIAYAGHQVQP